MDALDGAKLAIDRPWVGLLAGFREFGSEREQLAALITQLLQIGDQNILQIIVGAGTSMMGWRFRPANGTAAPESSPGQRLPNVRGIAVA